MIRQLRTGLAVALVALSLTVVGGPAAAERPTRHLFLTWGSSENIFDVSTCSSPGPGLVECDSERTASLVGLPFWLGSYHEEGTVVVDLGEACTDYLGRPSLRGTGTAEGTLTAGASQLYVRREYTSCSSAAEGGHSIGTLTFTGGTGAFEGASGSAVFMLMTETAPTGLFIAIGKLTL